MLAICKKLQKSTLVSSFDQILFRLSKIVWFKFIILSGFIKNLVHLCDFSVKNLILFVILFYPYISCGNNHVHLCNLQFCEFSFLDDIYSGTAHVTSNKYL